MLIKINGIVATRPQDAAIIPAVMLRFRPTESCAVIGMEGARVAVCARMDLEALDDEAALSSFADQMLEAISNCDVDEVLLVGYSDDHTEAARLLDIFAVRLAPHVHVALCIVTDHQTVWEVSNGKVEGEGIPFYLDDELNALEAVIPEGLRASRAEALAEVRPTLAIYEAAEVVLATAEALQTLDVLTPKQQQNRLRELLEGPALSLTSAVELAMLINNPDHVATVLDTITEANAETHRTQLVKAHKYCPQSYEASVIGLLALSCWLANEGAQMADCMEQLEHHSPGHPLLSILLRVHYLPPSVW